MYKRQDLGGVHTRKLLQLGHDDGLEARLGRRLVGVSRHRDLDDGEVGHARGHHTRVDAAGQRALDAVARERDVLLGVNLSSTAPECLKN